MKINFNRLILNVIFSPCFGFWFEGLSLTGNDLTILKDNVTTEIDIKGLS